MKSKFKKLGKRFGRFFFTFSLCFVLVFYSTISVCYADSWTTDVGEWISNNPDSPISEGFNSTMSFISENYDSIDNIVDGTMATAIELAGAISNPAISQALQAGLSAISLAAANGNKLTDIITDTVVNPDLEPGEGAVAFTNVNWTCNNGYTTWDSSTFYEDSSGGWKFVDMGSACTLQIWGMPGVIPSRVVVGFSGGLNSKFNASCTKPRAEYNDSSGLNFALDSLTSPDGLYNMWGTGSSSGGGYLEFKVNNGAFDNTTTFNFGYYHTATVTHSPVSFISAFRSGCPRRPVPSDFTQAEIDNGDYVRAVIVYDYVDSMINWLEDVQSMPEHDILPYIQSNALGFVPDFWTQVQTAFLSANPVANTARTNLMRSTLKSANLSTPRSFLFDFDGVTVPIHDDLVFTMPELHLWINGFGSDTLYWDTEGDAGYITIPSGLSYLWNVLAYFIAVMWTYALMKSLLKCVLRNPNEGGSN